RIEPRKVECDVIFDYADKLVHTEYEGTRMDSRKMSSWEFDERPGDILPKKEEESDERTELDKAMEREEEIAEKTENMEAVSANVKETTEAKKESSVIIHAETLD
nr:hypothetical protein [Gammaproteobacteria bacterium]